MNRRTFWTQCLAILTGFSLWPKKTSASPPAPLNPWRFPIEVSPDSLAAVVHDNQWVTRIPGESRDFLWLRWHAMALQEDGTIRPIQYHCAMTCDFDYMARNGHTHRLTVQNVLIHYQEAMSDIRRALGELERTAVYEKEIDGTVIQRKVLALYPVEMGVAHADGTWTLRP